MGIVIPLIPTLYGARAVSIIDRLRIRRQQMTSFVSKLSAICVKKNLIDEENVPWFEYGVETRIMTAISNCVTAHHGAGMRRSSMSICENRGDFGESPHRSGDRCGDCCCYGKTKCELDRSKSPLFHFPGSHWPWPRLE